MTTRRTFVSLMAALPLLALEPARAAADPLALAGTRSDGGHAGPGDLGGWRLVYFGYTHCPDICPLGLQTIAEAMDALGPLGARVTPVFVTVDPERDTPALMKDYVAFFHPRLVGLSPSEDELKAMAKAWRVKYARVEIGEGRPYLMDHTATILLADPTGAPAGRFGHDLGGAKLAEKIRAQMEARP